jgi:predicted CXXCH cytochrome family protein
MADPSHSAMTGRRSDVRNPADHGTGERSGRRPGVVALLLAVCAVVYVATLALAARQPQAEECLECHRDPVEFAFSGGTTKMLRVEPREVERSVHAQVACADCHPGTTDVPHPERKLFSARQLTVAASEQCRQCHFAEYRQSLESVHARAVARGDFTAPVCVDCHGGHDIQPATEPRTRVAEMCGRCHTKTAGIYAASVHGQDVARNVADVPTCTDCHGAHQIAGPGQPGWRSSTPEICGGCHGDRERMEKYGLSPNVLQTYLADFHGKTARLRAAAEPHARQTVVAVCSDCHGTHNVARVDSPSSPVVKANIARTCRRCHTEAGTDFPDAWLSHYEPNWRETPLLMTVRTGYAILIPFMIGGMMLQILLHLWRMAVNR